MKKIDLQTAVGVFVLLGIFALGYLSVKFGKMEVIGGDTYTVYANFDRAGGIKPGAILEIAGVEAGKVTGISLNEHYQAVVELAVSKSIKLQEDAIASIKTKGLIGEKYVQITPGGSDRIVTQGGTLRETESAIDIEELVSKYVFGEV
jgi:phospholipid/cholesterol/gamma-HCH transport system substrate-binding protein